MNRDNKDTQLVLNRGLPVQVEPWAQSGALGAPQQPQPSPLRKMHQLLRGRYFLAGMLALIGALIGGGAGFFSQKPGFRSDGLIEIKPIIPSPDSYDRVMLMYQNYVASQVARMKSERLINMAIQRPEWKAVRPSDGPDTLPLISENLIVMPIRGSSLIQVSFTDPTTGVAPAIVKAVIETYKDNFSRIDLDFTDRKIALWETVQRNAARDIELNKRLIDGLVADYGYDDLSVLLTTKLQELAKLETMVRDAENALEAATDPAAGQTELSVEEIARLDQVMANHVQERSGMELKLEELRASLGENHPLIQTQKQKIEVRNRVIETYAKDFRAKFSGLKTNPDGTASLLPKDPTELKGTVQRMQAQFRREKEATIRLGQRHHQIQNAKAEILALTAKLNQAEERLEEFRFQRESIGELSVISEGNAAVTAIDNRAKFGILGLLAGAGFPVGLLLLIGLLDHRYRFSDETGTEMTGITLLGILPNLPDRLSDPEQAAIAAHCVHQIRTMLQINGAHEERRVFAVTSASPGDGKTSLTLALGLSYAACGARTLLIDCDLVGAGLTARMNVNAPEGVLEAIANRSLLEYVRTTDIADVALLPVGSSMTHHASTLSPAALRRMIEEAEKHFEVILIDTGPILGSIEASMVCAAADGVVLTVARGQQRPLVERSLSHLHAIGARLAGVVFNRAQANDFERSISGASLRNVSVGVHRSSDGTAIQRNGKARYGPVARSVASQGTTIDDEE